MNPPTPLVKPISPSQVQESRTKRLDRQQARFRDRGGIFVPRTHNNLLDILLGRKRASSPKRRSRSRSLSVSPTKRFNSKRGPSIGRKSGGIVSKTSSQRKARTPVGDRDRDDESDQPVAGPSRLPKKPLSKAATSRKGKKAVLADDDTPAEIKAVPKRKGRTAKPKQPIEESIQTTTKVTIKPTTMRKTKTTALDDSTTLVPDDETRPGSSKKRTAVSKARASRKTTEADDNLGEENAAAKSSKSGSKSVGKTGSSATVPKPKAKPKARSTKVSEDAEVDVDPPPPRTQRSQIAKSRQTYAELSDDEEEERPKASRGKKIAMAPPATNSSDHVSAKRKGKQREVDDIVSETPTVGKTKGKGKLREQVAEKPSKPKAKPAGKKRALEPEDDDGEGDPPVKKRKAALLAKEVDDPPSRKRLEVILEEDEEEVVAFVETPAQPVKKSVLAVEDPKGTSDSVAPVSKKRTRERNEDAAGQTTRKRVKVAEVKEASAAPTKPKKRAPAKRSKPASKNADDEGKRVRIPSRTLKENTPTSHEQQQPITKATSAQAVKNKGPPKSILDRVRSHAGSRLVADDDEPDELDFLS